MLFIETKGTWREMGRQLGEAFSVQLEQCIENFFLSLCGDDNGKQDHTQNSHDYY